MMLFSSLDIPPERDTYATLSDAEETQHIMLYSYPNCSIISNMNISFVTILNKTHDTIG
jgi:hypothetical protein